MLQKSLAFSGEGEKSSLACAEAGPKAGQLLRAAHARPSGTASHARSARGRPSSEGEGGHRLLGGFLGIQMKFYETALCFLACTGTNYSMAKELIFSSCQHSLFFGVHHCILWEFCPCQRRSDFRPIDTCCILVQNAEEISRRKLLPLPCIAVAS